MTYNKKVVTFYKKYKNAKYKKKHIRYINTTSTKIVMYGKYIAVMFKALDADMVKPKITTPTWRNFVPIDLLIKLSGNLKINTNAIPATKDNNGDPFRITKNANSIPV